jgi:hypothetical protein
VVERHVANVAVVGSSPITRSYPKAAVDLNRIGSGFLLGMDAFRSFLQQRLTSQRVLANMRPMIVGPLAKR